MFNGLNMSDVSDYKFGSQQVSYVYYGSTLIWPKTHNYSRDYLTFEALAPTTFAFTDNALQYSLDDGATWTTLQANTSTPTLSTGDKILWKQNGSTIPAYQGLGEFSSTGQFKVYGNIMSLLFGDNFIGEIDLTGQYGKLRSLFHGCQNLIDAQNLILPATTLTINCYYGMFDSCTSLTTAPALPATTLAGSCYAHMFWGCTSLTTAPALPATTLATYCYENMFYGCTSLTTAPALPATTMYDECYCCMFQGCTSLTTSPELPATTLATECYGDMFRDCTSLTTAPELPATTLAANCYQGMFRHCTSMIYGPTQLPATTLAANCYQGMFRHCTSMIYGPTQLPATTLADYCYQSMFYLCISLTDAPVLPATTLTNYCYKDMFHDCSSLVRIHMYATNISATDCLSTWVANVAQTGTFVKSPNMTTLPTGVNGIPADWTVIDIT